MAYDEIAIEDALKLEDDKYRHASHVMVYAQWPGKLFGKYEHKYAVMMQMRFDGSLGFPGGIMDVGESPQQTAEREFREETGLCLHFYSKEVSMETLYAIEKSVPLAVHWGSEVLGSTRCPLYTLPNGLGLPAFLRHQFIGNSRQQLLLTIVKRGLLSKDEVDKAIETSSRISGMVTKDEIDY